MQHLYAINNKQVSKKLCFLTKIGVFLCIVLVVVIVKGFFMLSPIIELVTFDSVFSQVKQAGFCFVILSFMTRHRLRSLIYA